MTRPLRHNDLVHYAADSGRLSAMLRAWRRRCITRWQLGSGKRGREIAKPF